MHPAIENVRLEMIFYAEYLTEPPVIAITSNQHLIVPEIAVHDTLRLCVDLRLPNDRVEPGEIEIRRSNFDGANQQQLTLSQIYLDGINLEKICYQSRYYPEYPEPWISQQRSAGIDWPEYLTGATTWGWNGVWVLNYETPIYTWLLKNV